MIEMMIKKLNHIDNVFSYHKYDWDCFHNHCNDAFFSQINLIFGENGNGKTSLINIFKNLNGEVISLDKHRDINEDKQSIIITLKDDSVIEFNGEYWTNSSFSGKFVIFDKFFIEQYVHSLGCDASDNVSRRQQRGKNIVYLGNFHNYNMEIEKILNLKNIIIEKNRSFKKSYENKIFDNLKNTSISIKEINQPDFEFKLYSLNKSLIPELEKKLESAIKEKDNLNKIIADSDKIINIPFLKPCEKVNEINFEKIKDFFSFSISSNVKSIIEKIESKKDFIRMGLPYIMDNPEKCPFCERLLENEQDKERFRIFIDLFDTTFQINEQKTIHGLDKYENFLYNLDKIKIPANNNVIVEKLGQYVSLKYSLPEFDFSEKDKYVINNEIEIIHKKKESLLGKQINWDENNILELIKKYQDFITNYNLIVQDINEILENLKNKVRNSLLESSLKNIDIEIKNLEKTIDMILTKDDILRFYEKQKNYNNNDLIIKRLDRIYSVMKIKIVEKFKIFVEDYFEIINKFILELSPTMEGIEVFGTAKVDARNEREPFQCGFDIKYLGKENNCIYSEGEKQVIALSYFFAQLEKERDNNKIIIFDDPITNFDAGKRLKTSELIYDFSKKFIQTFLFTCDPLFRDYSIKILENRALFNIYKTRGFSAIHYISKKKMDICSSFEEDFRKIDEEHGSVENIIIYGNKLRYCLELKIKDDILGYSKDNLNEVITQISLNEGAKLKAIIENKNKILSIYRYCNSGGISHYPRESSPNWNELVIQINKYLELSL